YVVDAFPSALISDVAEILMRKDLTNSFDFLAKKSCEGNRIQNNSKVKISRKSHHGKETTLNVLNEQLTNGNILGIGYHPSLFTPAEGVQGHESTVVARKWNEQAKTCQFLVRNTYGPDHCEKTYSYMKCDEGHFWADQDDLLNSVVDVYYLE
ncbi:MAG: hypothetical protein NXH75_07280, partial [Halobacteriovoraceae bacterium]|nr:hypothetical protein [Halobacteriovoraceae bacterium]